MKCIDLRRKIQEYLTYFSKTKNVIDIVIYIKVLEALINNSQCCC